MSHLCDYTYAELAQGRNKVQLAELDAILAPPEEKEVMRARANQEAIGSLGIAMPKPPPRKAE